MGELNAKVLNVPLLTLPKIEAASKLIDQLQRSNDGETKATRKEIQDAIEKFGGILNDLKEVNQGHAFLEDSEKAQRQA